jgi:branched-chain amino acid transport system permease protein
MGNNNLRRHLLVAGLIALAFAVLPLLVTERYLLGEVIIFLIWSIVAANWNLLMGHAGVFSLAQMLFFATGAYGVAVATQFAGLSIWLAIPVAALAATLLALIIGAACLRLSGAYVALLTYAIAEMIHILIITDTACFRQVGGSCLQLFGGARGFSRFEDFGFRPLLKADWILGNYYVVWAVFAFTIFTLVVVIHGRLGLGFRAIRDNVGYAGSRGINRRKIQLIAFGISAFLSGLAGAVYAGHFRFAGPSLFEFSSLMFVLAMVIVGGLGSTWGPLIGAAAIMIVVEITKELGDARAIVLGLALILFVLFLPKGLAGSLERLQRVAGLSRKPVPEASTSKDSA